MDDLTTLMREAVEDVEPTDRRAELPRAGGGLVEGPAASLRRHGRPARRRRRGDGRRRGRAAVRRARDPAGRLRARRGPHQRAPSGVRALLRRRDPAGATAVPRVPRRSGAGDDAGAAISLLLYAPDDPDYTSYWSEGQLLGASVVERRHRGGRRPGPRSRGLLDEPGPPAGRLHASRPRSGDSPLPVQFVHDGNPVAEVGGLPTSEPLATAPQLDVLALASISDPAERRVVEGSFSANGRASSFEGNVPWELRDADGNVVREGSAQTYGSDRSARPLGHRPDRRVRPRPGRATRSWS